MTSPDLTVERNKILAQHDEVVRGMEPFVAIKLRKFLIPIEKMWQPSDLLPDMSDPNWQDKVVKLYEKHVRTADRVMENISHHRPGYVKVSWVHDREIPLRKAAYA